MSELDEGFWLPQDHDDVGFFGSVVGGAYLLFAIPACLWRLYVEYLWNWDKHPWVVSAAATFKLAAILIIAPFALLSLLDVVSYVIARTLGVVETTKASTSDSKDLHGVDSDSDTSETDAATSLVRIDVVQSPGASIASPPEADVHAAPSPPSGSTSSTSSGLKSRFDVDGLTIPMPHARFTHYGRAKQGDAGPEAEACFFSPSDERQLELSGALLSSPTPSRQSSPGLERHQRMQPLTSMDRQQMHDAAPSAGSDASSTADSESFTVLEPSEFNRDGPAASDSALDAMPNLRRRVPDPHDVGVTIS